MMMKSKALRMLIPFILSFSMATLTDFVFDKEGTVSGENGIYPATSAAFF